MITVTTRTVTVSAIMKRLTAQAPNHELLNYDVRKWDQECPTYLAQAHTYDKDHCDSREAIQTCRYHHNYN